jgi:hypothetical protein
LHDPLYLRFWHCDHWLKSPVSKSPTKTTRLPVGTAACAGVVSARHTVVRTARIEPRFTWRRLGVAGRGEQVLGPATLLILPGRSAGVVGRKFCLGLHHVDPRGIGRLGEVAELRR